MAQRRVRNPKPLWVLRSAHLSRVRRTAEKVVEGKVDIADVEGDIREEVDAKVKTKAKVKGGPG